MESLELASSKVGKPAEERAQPKRVKSPTARGLTTLLAELEEAEVEWVMEPVTVPVVEPVVRPVTEPVVIDLIAEPVIDSVVRPVADLIAEPVAELVADSVVKLADLVADSVV
jgi:hypothetical protein